MVSLVRVALSSGRKKGILLVKYESLSREFQFSVEGEGIRLVESEWPNCPEIIKSLDKMISAEFFCSN